MFNRLYLCKIAILIAFMSIGFISQAKDLSALTLQMSYEIALENNEQIQVSKEKIRQAKEDITVAESNLYPQLSATGRYTRQKELAYMSPDKFSTYGVELSQHIYQWGKVWSGKQIAEHYFQSSQFRHIRRLQEVLFNVSTRYFEALLGKRSIEIAQNALERAKIQLERAKGRYEVGVVTKTDVLRAEVQVAKAQESLERAENEFDIALENLKLELGVDSEPEKVQAPAKREFEETSIKELYQKALNKRRDLKQAKREVQALTERVDWQKADYYPKLSLEGKYTKTDEPLLYEGEDEDWHVALNLSLPIFTGGQISAEVQKARSNLREGKASLRRLKREIRNQVRSVYLNIHSQQKLIQQLKKQVQSARRNYQQVTAQFEEGLATTVDQVDAFTALNEAEHRLAQARYSYQLDLIRLKLAIGTFQSELLSKRSQENVSNK